MATQVWRPASTMASQFQRAGAGTDVSALLTDDGDGSYVYPVWTPGAASQVLWGVYGLDRTLATMIPAQSTEVSVTAHVRIWRSFTPAGRATTVALGIGSAEAGITPYRYSPDLDFNEVSPGSGYVRVSHTWTVEPWDSGPWAVLVPPGLPHINVGWSLLNGAVNSGTAGLQHLVVLLKGSPIVEMPDVRVTEAYLEVTYTPPAEGVFTNHSVALGESGAGGGLF